MIFRVLFCLLLSVPAFATCRFAQLAGPILVDRFHDRSVYSPFLCLYNSGELARILQTDLHRDIDPKRLRILVFRHSELPALDIPSYEVDRRHWIVAQNARLGESKVFKYHAVVEYEGQILDLDYGQQASVVPFPDYVQAMFPPTALPNPGDRPLVAGRSYNEPDSMSIMAIPAEEYLAHFKTRPGMGDGALEWANRYPATPLPRFAESLKVPR